MDRKEGALLCPFAGGAGALSNTMSPGRGLLPTKWRLHPSSRLTAIDMVPKLGAVPHLERGSWDPIERKVAWTEAYLHTKWHLSPSSRLATTDIGRKLMTVPL